MKLLKRMLIALLVACSLLLVAPVVTPLFQDSYTVEAASAKLNKTSITIGVGNTYKLKVQNNKKKVSWSSSNKKVAKVNQNGTVTGLKKGTVTITAKVGSKKYKCKVKVTKTPTLKANIKKTYKQGSYYIVEGYVKNNTYAKLSDASIQVTAYDKGGKKVGSSTNSIMWMDANGQWKVKVEVYVGNNNVAKYKTKVSGIYFNSDKYNPNFTTKVTKLTSKSSSLGTTYTATAKFTNKNKAKLTSVFATYAFYDKSGNIIGTRFCGYYKNSKDSKGKTIKGKLGNGLKKNKSFTASESLSYADYAVTKCKIVEAHGYDL